MSELPQLGESRTPWYIPTNPVKVHRGTGGKYIFGDRQHPESRKMLYALLVERQGGEFCAACGTIDLGTRETLAIDHDHNRCSDHRPNQMCENCARGLLCLACNIVAQDVWRVQGVLNYLQTWQDSVELQAGLL